MQGTDANPVDQVIAAIKVIAAAHVRCSPEHFGVFSVRIDAKEWEIHGAITHPHFVEHTIKTRENPIRALFDGK